MSEFVIIKYIEYSLVSLTRTIEMSRINQTLILESMSNLLDFLVSTLFRIHSIYIN